MVNVTLPDGSVRQFDAPVTVAQVASSIGAGLAKAALAGKVNGKLVDTSHLIDADAQLAIVTAKDAEALDLIRHDAAHVMAQAVQELYPGTQVTIGPAIEDGFYYDFARERAVYAGRSGGDRKTHGRDRQARPADPARGVGTRGRQARVCRAGRDLQGADHRRRDSGRRGNLHLPPGRLVRPLPRPAPAVDRQAAARVQADEAGRRLLARRLEEPDAAAHLRHGVGEEGRPRGLPAPLEEAEKRDHRRLAKQLDLFHMQDEAPGMVFWHPKGWIVWQQIEQYMRQKFVEYGYQEVRTPAVMDKSLWEKSGHWDNYRDNMFTTASENRDYAVKPMNCPGHVQIFNSGLHSYRDLPLRLAEFGSCHRNEPSGALHGIMRVRGFTQDDAHIFCTEDQIEQEVADFIVMLQKVYADFGFNDVLVKLSTRPDKRVGSDESWDKAEAALAAALDKNGLAYDLQPGEGAFYGPKIEFTLKDTLGRLWQCGTIQLDFNLPVRLGAEFVDEDNSRKPPVMLHRAILGSMERFIGILIEHHAGNFPLWLAPVQVMVMNISERQAEYAQKVTQALRQAGVRAVSDLSNNKITYKIREHSLQKLPYQVVVGDKEMETGVVSVRARGNQDLGQFGLDDLIARLKAETLARQ